jgi:hypothetical protein
VGVVGVEPKPILKVFVPLKAPVVASILGPPPVAHSYQNSKGKAFRWALGVLRLSSPSSPKPNFHSSGK